VPDAAPRPGWTELAEDQAAPPDLVERIRSGEIFVARGCLQRAGIFDAMREASLEGVRRAAGADLARRVEEAGFECIHDLAGLPQIAEITDATYAIAALRCPEWSRAVARRVFGLRGSFYFERSPNVRYVIPYDRMVEDPEVVERFAAAHGTGKISPHPCHRDSWVDCPDNLINVWAAIGPIHPGNGLALFPEVFGRPLRHLASGSIAFDEPPGAPFSPDLRPGDAILFQGDQLHASVLNRTDQTRHAVSFRIVPDKPHYPNGHYHHYAHSALAGGPLDALAELPANLSPSWLRTRLRWVAERLGLRAVPAAPAPGRLASGEPSVAIDAIAPNSLRAAGPNACLARIGDAGFFAFDRRCPHGGADLSLGTIDGGEVVCPWHNLRFDPSTGASACASLRRLRLHPVRVEGGNVIVEPAS